MKNLKFQRAIFLWLWGSLIGYAFPIQNQGIIVVEFMNTSDFKSTWDLEREIPQTITLQLEEKGFQASYKPVPHGVYGFKKRMKPGLKAICGTKENSKFVIAGEIQNYSLTRTGAGTGGIASLNSYVGKMEGAFHIYNCTTDSLTSISKKFSLRDNELGVRTPYIYLQVLKDQYEKKYRDLEHTTYGDSLFNQTIAGILQDSLTSFITSQVEKMGSISSVAMEGKGNDPIQDQKVEEDNKVSKAYVPGHQGHVVHANESQIYIDMGADNGLRVGDSVFFYKPGKPILDHRGVDTLGLEEEFVMGGVVISVKSSKLSIIQPDSQSVGLQRGYLVRTAK